MRILDTNMILRYLLNDNIEMADEVEKIIKEHEVLVLSVYFFFFETANPVREMHAAMAANTPKSKV